MQPASPVAMDARVLPDVGFLEDASTPDSGPPADAAADAGVALDGGPQRDGGPGPDGGAMGDAGPGPDGGPVGDAGPAADGGPMGDAGPGPDAGPLADGGAGNDGGPANDGGPGPDAGPLADGGPDAGLDAGNDAGPVDVGPIDAGTLAMIPTATTVPMGQSARFVVNAPSGAAVQWQVDGAVGGGTAMGTILPEVDPRAAIYTAPTVPGTPAPGSFEVSAVSGAETARAVVNLAYIAPSIATITPTELRSGQGTITVTLTGLGFTPQTQVYLDGLRLALATVRWDQLTFDIAPTLLTFPGPREIRVRNPLPGGGEAVITVLGVLSRTVLDPAVPADAPAVFTAATVGTDPTRMPAITYPEAQSYAPRDFPAPEVSFSAFNTHNICRVSADGPGVEVEVFVPTTGLTMFENPRAMIDNSIWGLILTSNPGISLVFQVACAEVAQVGGASQVVGGSIYESAPITYTVEPFAAGGRIIYFSGLIEGLWRIELGSFNPQGTPWIGPSPAFQFQTPGCVGCHSLTPSGASMSYTSGQSEFGVFNTLGGAPTVTTGLSAANGAEWTAIHPSGRWAVGLTLAGTLVLYDALLGTVVMPVPTAGNHTLHTQPFWSPQGDRLVFVATSLMGTGVHDVRNGEIWSVPFTGPATGAPSFGTPSQLVPSAVPGQNNFYPAVSPDGQWVLFARAPSGGSFNNPLARVQLVAANGTGAVIDLPNANQPAVGQFNSWPRWAPSVQQGRYWIIYSSQRPYPPLNGTGPQQLWVSEIDPSRLPADPSTPGIWLPGQEAYTGNLTAEWSISQ